MTFIFVIYCPEKPHYYESFKDLHAYPSHICMAPRKVNQMSLKFQKNIKTNLLHNLTRMSIQFISQAVCTNIIRALAGTANLYKKREFIIILGENVY